MEVVGCGERLPNEPVHKMIRPDELMDALPEADVVIMTAALNEENHHIVDESFINAMKSGATFVNIGREDWLMSVPCYRAWMQANLRWRYWTCSKRSRCQRAARSGATHGYV